MGVGIIGIGSYLPESVIDNHYLANRLGVDEEWILRKTGIRERRIAAPEEATSDLAVKAARRAIESAGICSADLGIIILASGSVDQPSPATACFIQAGLEARNSVAFDVTAACAGFIFGLQIAMDMLTAHPDRRFALVVGSEASSRFLDYEDKSLSVLAGDGAGAAILGITNNGGILACRLGTDGAFAELGQIPAGGSRRPASQATISAGLHYMTMKGRKIREFVAGQLPVLVKELLASIAMEIGDLDLIVLHQANGVMLREWAEILAFPADLMHETVASYGNTGAASVPVTLDDAIRKGRVSPGDYVLFVSFGAGVSWGACVVQWSDRFGNP